MTPTSYPRTRSLLALFLFLVAFHALSANAAETQPNQLTSEQIAEGWISLFDGETLFGWTPTSDANWQAAEGAIRVSDGAEGFLMTNSEFADYELHVEYEAPASTNSGVFLRTPRVPKDPAKDCYELNIAPPENDFPTGSLVFRRRRPLDDREAASNPPPSKGGARGGIPDANDSNKEGPSPNLSPRGRGISVQYSDAPGWHAFHIVANGNRLTVTLDGFELYVFEDDHAIRRGRIGLQFRQGPVAFRNIRLKPLGLKPMLNGRDLSGWNDDQKKTSKFEIVSVSASSGSLPSEGRAGEGGEVGTRSTPPSLTLPSEGREPDENNDVVDFALHVTNGSGQLESDATYGDFVMQFDTRVDGDGLNSGVFFRCIPREYMNGYECQIHNTVKDGDPTKPADFGTGAIYRRVPARRVNARDHEWFATTLVATGPHIAVWVNGLQVTDWTDPRPPHDNPRNGLRTAAGTIAIQGHDPTTNLLFRNLRIGELPGNANHEGTKVNAKNE